MRCGAVCSMTGKRFESVSGALQLAAHARQRAPRVGLQVMPSFEIHLFESAVTPQGPVPVHEWAAYLRALHDGATGRTVLCCDVGAAVRLYVGGRRVAQATAADGRVAHFAAGGALLGGGRGGGEARAAAAARGFRGDVELTCFPTALGPAAVAQLTAAAGPSSDAAGGGPTGWAAPRWRTPQRARRSSRTPDSGRVTVRSSQSATSSPRRSSACRPRTTARCSPYSPRTPPPARCGRAARTRPRRGRSPHPAGPPSAGSSGTPSHPTRA